MTRRPATDILAAVVCCMTICVTSPLVAARPNIILVMSDDQGWGDVGYNGHPKIKTPELDAMAKAGIRFDRFYAGASVCSPTRVTCLTGRNNWRVNIGGPARADEAHLPREELTLPEVLKPHGYVSGHFGKWHVGGMTEEDAGDHVMTPGMAGFDEWFSTHNVVVTFDPYRKEHKGGNIAMYWHNGRNIPRDEALKDPSLRGDDATIVMNKSLDFIRKQVSDERPFLSVIWFHNVHTPLGKNPELMEQYSECDTQEQIYFSNITAIDTQVGRLRRELRKLGVADDTMLWFTSDNGPNLKGKKNIKYGEAQGGKFNYTPIGSTGAFRGWKRHCHEGGLRVPGLLEWPARIQKPLASDFPAVTSDYLPTILDALDIPLPADRSYDGVSLLPMIDGTMQKRPSPIGFHCNGWQAWSGQRYKIVREHRKGAGEWELYDIADDPFEEHDLAQEKPELLKQMTGKFQKWFDSVEADRSHVLAKYYAAKKPRKRPRTKLKRAN